MFPAPPTAQYIQLSDAPPSIFTSPDDLDHSFNLRLQLPIPNVLHRSAVRNVLAHAMEELPDLQLSLEVTYGSHLVYNRTSLGSGLGS
jgi:hypothetical protein